MKETDILLWIQALVITLAFSSIIQASDQEPAKLDTSLKAAYNNNDGRVTISEAGHPILVYNYQNVAIPDNFFSSMSKKMQEKTRKYARARSNYIHPLFGPDGQTLTSDWSKDHPHHRGIYWAWPEVQFNGELGDLHALQKVWARPTGKIKIEQDDAWVELESENLWMWEDQTSIVHELAKIRVWKSGQHGRYIDLTLSFKALKHGVSLARRKTINYGGLNIRLAPIANMSLSHHTDSEGDSPLMAWQTATGRWNDTAQTLSMAIFEKNSNPLYPGDFIEYPKLPWFQPSFPKSGHRYALDKGQTLKLRYRIWIRRGPVPDEKEFRTQWNNFNNDLMQ